MEANQALKEQLDTSGRSESSYSEEDRAQPAQEEEEEEEEEMQEVRGGSSAEEEGGGSEGEHQALCQRHGHVVVSPESRLSWDVIESAEQQEAKYFPPKKSPPPL